MRIGITVQQDRADLDAAWVQQALRGQLDQLGEPIEGFCSLAAAIDRVFARILLEGGNSLFVVVPRGLPDSLPEPAKVEFRTLSACAREVFELGRHDDSVARYIVDSVHTLVAVWDGQAPCVAAIVEYAYGLGRSIIHVDPVSRRVRLAVGTRLPT